MAAPITPLNFVVQQANRENWLTWDLAPTALTYDVQRSVDNITYSTIASVAINNYLDTGVVAGTNYFYKVRAVNGDGPSAYTTEQIIIPTPTAEMSLLQIRDAAKQRADMVNSEFVTNAEWNSYIRQSMYELYDLLITTEPDRYIGIPIQFTSTSTTGFYPLPNGLTTYINALTQAPGFVAPPFYKLMGVDLSLNVSATGYVTLDKFNFIERNKYIYNNGGVNLLGYYSPQYRLIGLNGVDNVQLIPAPTTNNLPVRVWYVPRLNELLKDTDLSSTSISGWIEYVIVDAAIKAMQKEESDVSALMAQKQALKQRIEEAAANRDLGRPDTISDSRRWSGGPSGSWGGGWMGGM